MQTTTSRVRPALCSLASSHSCLATPVRANQLSRDVKNQQQPENNPPTHRRHASVVPTLRLATRPLRKNIRCVVRSNKRNPVSHQHFDAPVRKRQLTAPHCRAYEATPLLRIVPLAGSSHSRVRAIVTDEVLISRRGFDGFVAARPSTPNDALKRGERGKRFGSEILLTSKINRIGYFRFANFCSTLSLPGRTRVPTIA